MTYDPPEDMDDLADVDLDVEPEAAADVVGGARDVGGELEAEEEEEMMG
ncbi:MAG TPA: hypothetical protein VML96_07075 [Egibacteraceae bacterium]|nr:hypothetical protein [Egibacteraceae bacterium]